MFEEVRPTVLRFRHSSFLLLSNGTDLPKTRAKLSCVGFRTSGYEIKDDMAAWQLVIVTGQGISPSSSIGTSTFYTAAKGDKSVVIDPGLREERIR